MTPDAMTSTSPHYLNLGCGARFQPGSGWTNLDFISHHPRVRAHDLNQGLPFPDGSYDGVYHSHVLEHFTAQDGLRLLRECFRVLRPGGVIRVVVPDLERIATGYLEAVAAVRAGRERALLEHEWMILELYDQTTRQEPGGLLGRFCRERGESLRPFIEERYGRFATDLLNPPPHAPAPSSLLRRKLSWLRPLYRFLRHAPDRRETILKWVLGKDYPAFVLGRFRREGEIHQQMYDRINLASTLAACGFEQISVRNQRESAIPGWPDFHLDTDPDGATYKADSLFMEARRPSA